MAREESAKLLLKKVGEIAGKAPAIITGDFNANPDSQVYEWLTKGYSGYKGFYDSYDLASKPYGPFWTSNRFGEKPVNPLSRIDYIFLNKETTVSKYVSIAEQRGDIFPSDHNPVMAVISFE